MSYSVSVRTLAAFTAKRGDLDFRFTPSPSAAEGRGIHQLIAENRGPSYEPEFQLSGVYSDLTVSGRADGFDPELGFLEEIKTHRVPMDRVPSNYVALAWAQLKIYAGLLALTGDWPGLELRLTYVHIETLEETTDVEFSTREALIRDFNQHCEAFLQWSEQETHHRQRRDQTLKTLAFPYPEFRQGQRDLSEAVYRGVQNEHPVLAEATTGIGKTLGTLFPQIKAMGHLGLDRVFYLTAKNSGRPMALEALQKLNETEQVLRIMEMSSLEAMCEEPTKACHGDSCPLAKGFYDRLPAARKAAAQEHWLDRHSLKTLASQHALCPYWLSHEMAQWVDVIVGDYNYYFDGSALLHTLTEVNQWRVGVLVDEAHNLLTRARAMYSVALDQASLNEALQTAPSGAKQALQPLARTFGNTFGTLEAGTHCMNAIPESFIADLQKAITGVTRFLADAPQRHDGPFMRFFFDALSFVRLMETFDEDSLFSVTIDDQNPLDVQTRFNIDNLIPAKYLSHRFETAVSTTLFSATLSPHSFHKDLLGMPDVTRPAQIPSPFSADQLRVVITTDISTRFEDREGSLEQVASTIIRQMTRRPGNYIAFFGSYDYLKQVQTQLVGRGLDLHPQTRELDLDEKDAWLKAFQPGGRKLGLAVLGGSFAEGVDLPGERLVGAFITTMGLAPQTTLNEAIRERNQARFQKGYDYTYRYPAMQKVVQAAGRVIRDVSDTGVVYLLDHRYADTRALDLLPQWWRVTFEESQKD